jgi:hypothetical protein
MFNLLMFVIGIFSCLKFGGVFLWGKCGNKVSDNLLITTLNYLIPYII